MQLNDPIALSKRIKSAYNSCIKVLRQEQLLGSATPERSSEISGM
jgi:hypothetical protein